MNSQLDLRYHHTEHSRVFRDVRNKPVAEIAPEQCYFLGFRISIANDYHYQHALVLADNYAALNRGVQEERDAIFCQSSATYARDITLVFVRNLEMFTPFMLDLAEHSSIQSDVQRVLSRRDDNQFTVLGQRGNSVTLMSIQTSDALTAIQLAYNKTAHMSSDELKPLEVLQAHPVTQEFDVLFLATAKRIQYLISSVLPLGNGLH